MNLLMGYDTASGSPVFSHMYRGSAQDARGLADASAPLEMRGLLSLADRGFYTEANMRLFSPKGNSFIMPVPPATARSRTPWRSSPPRAPKYRL